MHALTILQKLQWRPRNARRHLSRAQARRSSRVRRAFFELLEDRRMLAAAPVDLSMLDGSNGFRIGENTAPFPFASTSSVSVVGDVNGDGFDDLIIGTATASPSGVSRAGESFLVFGQAGGFAPSHRLPSLHAVGFIGAEELGGSGFSVSGAGDVNGDGFDDLIIGATREGPDGLTQAGATYVVFGRAADFPATTNLAELDGVDGFRLDGIDSLDFSGNHVAAAGDVNGDGLNDLIIGARYANSRKGNQSDLRYAGESYVVFGQTSGFPAVLKLNTLDGANGFRIGGAQPFGQLGFSVASAGDVNADGFDDVIMGAPLARGLSTDPIDGAGESYVVFGKASAFSAFLDVTELDGANGFRIDGTDQLDMLGHSVSSAGDINGDGFGDLMIGAPRAFMGNIDAGASYVVLGKAGGFPAAIAVSSLNGANGFKIEGFGGGDKLGSSLAAGDVNGDGFDDMIIGAPGDVRDGERRGAAYVVFGKPGSFPATLRARSLSGSDGFRLRSLDGDDKIGGQLSAGGDFNGDGYDDLILETTPRFLTAGAYVVLGADFGSHVTHAGTAAADTLNGDSLVDVMIGGQGDDVLRGRGGADVLRGGEGDDVLAVADLDFARLVGGNGTDTLRLDGNDITLDLTAISDNRIVDIEVIDLTGGTGNALVLNAQEVLNLSSHRNALVVRHAGSQPIAFGSGWRAERPVVVDGEFHHVLRHVTSIAAIELVNPLAWQNPLNRFDVNMDGMFSINDILAIVNTINGEGVRKLATPTSAADVMSRYYDLNGDGFVTPGDVLVGINKHSRSQAAAEGEAPVVFQTRANALSSREPRVASRDDRATRRPLPRQPIAVVVASLADDDRHRFKRSDKPLSESGAQDDFFANLANGAEFKLF